MVTVTAISNGSGGGPGGDSQNAAEDAGPGVVVLLQRPEFGLGHVGREGLDPHCGGPAARRSQRDRSGEPPVTAVHRTVQCSQLNEQNHLTVTSYTSDQGEYLFQYLILTCPWVS